MRATVLGGPELFAVAATLGLEAAGDEPDLALVDLRDASAVAGAAALPRGLPRIVVADAAQRALARALAVPDELIAASCEPAVIGPLLAAAVPPVPPRATRVVLATAARGGTGRTLLVANLARRLAPRCSTLVLDATGTGAAGWWLGVRPRPWGDLEGLAAELTPEHLAVVAEEAGAGLRVVGGGPRAPSAVSVVAAARAAVGLCALVLVDAPVLADERTAALLDLADRVLVLTYGDAVSRDLLDLAEVPGDTWRLASQSVGGALGPEVFFAVPRDEQAVSAAVGGRRPAGGALGRAYDVLADLLAEDAAR